PGPATVTTTYHAAHRSRPTYTVHAPLRPVLRMRSLVALPASASVRCQFRVATLSSRKMGTRMAASPHRRVVVGLGDCYAFFRRRKSGGGGLRRDRPDRTELRVLRPSLSTALVRFPGLDSQFPASRAERVRPTSRRDTGGTPGRQPRGIRRADRVLAGFDDGRRSGFAPKPLNEIGRSPSDLQAVLLTWTTSPTEYDSSSRGQSAWRNYDYAPETASDVWGGVARSRGRQQRAPRRGGLDVLSRTDCWRRQHSALSPGAASTELLSAGACEAVAGTATTNWPAEERHIPEHLVAKSIHSEGFQRRDDYEELPMSFCHDSIRLPASSASSSKTSSLDGGVDRYGPRLDGRAEVGQVWSYYRQGLTQSPSRSSRAPR
ncbi:hypothetical protein THAOC_28488, partial [Thalassiosira oceanica]